MPEPRSRYLTLFSLIIENIERFGLDEVVLERDLYEVLAKQMAVKNQWLTDHGQEVGMKCNGIRIVCANPQHEGTPA